MHRSQDRVAVDFGTVDLVRIDICEDVVARLIPEAIGEEAGDLRCLLAWLAGLIQSLSPDGALDEGSVLGSSCEE